MADFDRVKDAVAEALERLQETLDLDAGGFYQNAAVKSDDKALRKALEKANRVCGRCHNLWIGTAKGKC